MQDFSTHDRSQVQNRSDFVFDNYDFSTPFDTANPTLTYTVPMAFVSEAEKFKKNKYGQSDWFLNTIRGKIATLYNPFVRMRSTSSQYGTNGGSVIRMRIKDEISQNMRFYYGIQNEKDFPYSVNDSTIHVPGQDLHKYVNHMTGTMYGIFEPLKQRDNINATVKDEDAIEGKNHFFELASLLIADKELAGELKANGFSIKNPMNEFLDVYDMNPTDLAEVKGLWKLAIEEASESLIRDIYLRFDVEQIFTKNAVDQVVNNISTVIFKEEGNYYRPIYVPADLAIIDFSAQDMYGDDMTTWGYVEYVHIDTFLCRYPDMNPAMRQDMINLAGDNTCNHLRGYYDNMDNIQWYNAETQEVAVAHLWWIAPRDTRQKKSTNRYGKQRTIKIDDNEKYGTLFSDTVTYDENGNVKRIAGADISGDYRKYDIHRGSVWGNKYVMDYGYEKTVYRPKGESWKPIPNAVQFINNKNMDMFRSVVSRLKWNQLEKDHLKRKIQEMVEKDMGVNYVLYANKVDADLLEMISNFKGVNLHIVTGSDGDASDPNQQAKIFNERIDMSLTPSVQLYMELVRAEQQEMADIANIPQVALGQDTTTTGKAVREGRLNSSSYATLLFYKNFSNFCMKVLQRTFDYNRANLPSIKDKSKMPLSNKEWKAFDFVKEFSSADIELYITEAWVLDERSEGMIKDTVLAWNQNLQYLKEYGLTPVDPLEFIANPSSFKHTLNELKAKMKIGERESMKRVAAQGQAQQQQEQQMMLIQAQMEQMKKSYDVFETWISAISKNPQMLSIQQQLQPIGYQLAEQTFTPQPALPQPQENSQQDTQ